MTVDLRLAVPVAAAWCVSGVLIGAPGLLGWGAVALWAGAGLVVVGALLVRRRGLRTVLAGLLLALTASALVVTCAAVRAPARQPSWLQAAADAGRQVTAQARVDSRAADDGPFAATLSVAAAGTDSRRVDVPVTVFPGFGERHETADIGATVRLRGRLVANDPAEETAFRLYLAEGPRVLADPPWYLAGPDALRAAFRHAASTLPGDGGALLPGLAIGDTAAVSDELDAAMKASSLSHLTAVSGANCAVVVGLVVFAGAALGLPRALRVGGAVVVLVGFVVLVTPQPSVLRAAVMATLVLAAVAGGRPVRGVPVLALASVVLLVSDPWMARSYGFVLSVLATAGLLVLSGPIARRLELLLPRAIAMAVAVPLAAQLACQPVLVLLNPVIPTYGVLANMLAEPAAPVATVAGLAACLVLPVVPGLGAALAWVAWAPAAWIGAVARFFVGLPASGIPWPQGWVGVLLLTGVIVLTVIVVVGGTARGRALLLRRGAAALLGLGLVSLIGVTAGTGLREQLSRPDDWEFAACDIGQGDAVLIRSRGLVALSDTGPDPAKLSACLGKLGIGHIDLLVLSHYDLDHVGGTSAVFGMVDLALVGPTDGGDDQQLDDRLAASGARVEHASQGMTGRLGELRWQVLWPRARLGPVEPGNDASVTVRYDGAGECAGGCLSGMFLGDLGDEPQALVLGANAVAPVDVVKVAHHGSADQNPRMYERLHASVGLISVGADNGYGHPTDRLLGILRGAGTAAERTDLQGMVLVSPRPDGTMSVWSERADRPDEPVGRRG